MPKTRTDMSEKYELDLKGKQVDLFLGTLVSYVRWKKKLVGYDFLSDNSAFFFSHFFIYRS